MSTIAWTIEAQFDGIPLEITSLATERKRRVTIYVPVRGEESELFDQGSEPTKYSITATLTGSPEGIASNLVALEDLADNGEVRAFSHPIRGDIECHLESLSSSQDNGAISVSMMLVAVSQLQPAGANLSEEDTTRHDVEFAAAAAEQAIGDAGITGVSSPVDVVAPVLSWDDSTPVAVQRIQSDAVADSLRSTEQSLRSRTDLEAYQALTAVTVLRGRVVQYARTLQGRGVSYTAVQIRADLPVPHLLIQLGLDVETWQNAIVAVNSIRRVNRLAAGTSILIPRMV